MAGHAHRSGGARRKRLLIPLALAAIPTVAATALAAGPDGVGAARARGPAGVSIRPLVQATIAEPVRARSAGITIRTKGPREVLGTSIAVAPGGTFGWHTHPGPVLVAVASGTLSLYQPHRHGCSKRKVGPGQAFVENGGDVHLARNEGAKPVRLYATFLARTGTSKFLTRAPNPGTCHV
jgi:quercetin dioxygenase-like cupin family protein